MKKLLCLFVLCGLFASIGCGSSSSTTPPKTTPPTATPPKAG